MRVLVLGSLNIDLIFSVEHIVRPGETVKGLSFTRSAGGKGANQAASLAKAGLSVYLAGKIGQDGLFLLDLLKSYNVNTDKVLVYEGATGQAIIQLDKHKQNSIVLFDGGNGAITLREIDEMMDGFGSGDMILLQNEIKNIDEIMKKAAAKDITICFNPSPFDESINDLPLELVNLFFVNDIEGAGLAQMQGAVPDILETLVKKFPNAEIVLTAGKDGALYGFHEERAAAPIVEAPVIDTVGAGDTFTGYFLAAREKKLSAKEALALACRAASITVSRSGAMEAIPFAREVIGPFATRVINSN
jgi:ribokinase